MAGDAYRYLLDLDGFSHPVGPESSGYACTIRAQEKHGGVSYAVVLCDRYGNRILGFDNFHGYDHEHPPRQGKPYRFTTAERLMADFYERVDAWFAQHEVKR